MRDKAWRLHKRAAKRDRRMKEDRNQHRTYGQETLEEACACFGSEDKRLDGLTKSRFADTPKGCSCWMCCNPRKSSKHSKEEFTFQEKKALLKYLDFKGEF